jgi:LPXTG-site transpeptidase (sortase) family protein
VLAQRSSPEAAPKPTSARGSPVRGSLRVAVLLAAVLVVLLTSMALAPAVDTPELVPSTPAAATAAPAIATVEAPREMPAASAPTQIANPVISIGYRISIPRLRIDLPIAEGDVKRDIDDQRTPESFAFHLPGTALPGQHGNVYLYAHARQGMFLALWNARPGDEVLITSPDGLVLVYVVREILPQVLPTDVSSTRPTASERLTLQTSTGPSASDPRFVVFAFPRGE